MKNIRKKLLLIAAIDAILIAAAITGAYLIRFELYIPEYFQQTLLTILPWIVGVKLIIFSLLGLYKGMWRYTSIGDLLKIIKAASLGSLMVIAFILLRTQFIGFSRSVFIIDWFLTIILISGFRLSVRLFYERASTEELTPSAFLTWLRSFSPKKKKQKKLIIIGAGYSGEKICREIRNNPRLNYDIAGFIDDDPRKIGRAIHDVKTIGTVDELSAAVIKTQADEILIATASAGGNQMRRIVDACKETGIPFKIIPGMGELINGKISVNTIREVAYRDLLGRKVIKLETEKIGAYLKDQCVLVTGAGGSIGSELCRQICRFHPKTIVLLERAESPLYEIELELKKNFPNTEVEPLLEDIQDQMQVEKAFARYRPNTVFHAAAYKHVPMLEIHPWKATQNNIGGTMNMVNVASKFQVERFVLVSTDKAVRPANVMGASKRVSEMLVQNQNTCHDSHTRFMVVRFGNVVGSVGSVVPHFKKQIKNGGPVTVTHPEVTRFFMTIPEASQLILQAGAMGMGGEIFLLDMGTSVKIDDMARDLIRLSGLEPDVDIPIVYTGLRPGEKLYEELIVEGEGNIPTSHEKILILKGLVCNPKTLNGKIDKLNEFAQQHDREKIIQTLKEIVPDYLPASHSSCNSS